MNQNSSPSSINPIKYFLISLLTIFAISFAVSAVAQYSDLSDDQYQAVVEADLEEIIIQNKNLRHSTNLAIVSCILLLIAGVVIWRLQKKNRENLRLRSLEAEERAALNSTMMRNTHHRIKNHLHMISGLINLKSNEADNLEVRDILKDVRNRIHTIAHIHELLCMYILEDSANVLG